MDRSTTISAINDAPEDIRRPSQMVSDLDQLQDVVQAACADIDSDWNDVSHFWNPGPATFREHAKLRLLHGIAVGSGCFRPIFGRLATSTFGVLTYHRITERRCASRDGRATEPSINVSPEQFRKQLLGLKEKGFQFCSLADVIEASSKWSRQGGSFPERLVAVTFDDIYDNVFHNAWPVLKEFKIPATVFISTAFLDSIEPFPFDHWAKQFLTDVPRRDWLPIQSKNLEQMLDSDLIDVGAHTHTHQDFRTRPHDFARDLNVGIEQLQNRFCEGELPFAFPYGIPRLGFANQQLMEHVRDAELTCGLTTGSHTNACDCSPFGWGRFHVFEHDTAASLSAKLDGYYQWLPAVKNKVTSAFKR